jgi:N utilization substance protein A
MDIVEWNEDPAVFIANALNPAEVSDVIFDAENPKACTVVVPDYQLSLAIGKRGQNARLAAKLTGYKIDIKSESDMKDFYAQLDNEEVVEEIDATIDEAEVILNDNATSVDE